MLLPGYARVRFQCSNPRKIKLVMGPAKFLKLDLVTLFTRWESDKNNRFQLLDNTPASYLAEEVTGTYIDR